MKILLAVLTVAGAVYLMLAGFLWAFQEQMVFLPQVPGRALTGTPADAGYAYEDVTLVTADGVTLHGWYVPAAERRGTLLFFHGNAGNISHRLTSIGEFRSLGLGVLIIDYRGYGRSAGRPSEAGLYRDAAAAWRHLTEERAIPAREIVLFGRSLGGAVAAELARTRSSEPPAALIVESAMTSARELARQLYPIFPAALILRLRLNVRDAIARAPCPVLVVHARQDEIIPFAMGEALYRAAPEPKAFLALQGDHNTAFVTDLRRWRDGLRDFLDRHLSRSAPAE